MLQIRDHGVDDYSALRDMDDTDVGVLDESDRACLDEIGEYLATTDAWQRFSIWLLHRHFAPRDGEVFVEHAFPEVGRTETAPAQRAAFDPDGLRPSAIRFDDTELVGLEFATPADFGNVTPFGPDDEGVLADLAERLRVRGKIDRFGVRLIRDPLRLAAGELLLETCDADRRSQNCEVSSRTELPADRAIIETTWRWRLTAGTSHPVVLQECTAGCTPALADGHVLEHTRPPYEDEDV